jgi:hypothetical protein
VGHVNWAQPLSSTITWHLWVSDALSGQYVPDVQVQVCSGAPGDGDCPYQYAQGMTGDGGYVQLAPSADPTIGPFGGYVLLTSPSDAGPSASIYPEYWYPGFPLSEAAIYEGLNTFTLAEVGDIASSEHGTQDPSRGIVLVTAIDCGHAAAPGVQVSLGGLADATTQCFSISTGEALAPGTITGTAGQVVCVNVLVNSTQIAGTLMATGETVGLVGVYVRPQAITWVELHATPSP